MQSSFNRLTFTASYDFNGFGQLLDNGYLGSGYLGIGRRPKAATEMSDDELLADAISTLHKQTQVKLVDPDSINQRLVEVLTELGKRIFPIFQAPFPFHSPLHYIAVYIMRIKSPILEKAFNFAELQKNVDRDKNDLASAHRYSLCLAFSVMQHVLPGRKVKQWNIDPLISVPRVVPSSSSPSSPSSSSSSEPSDLQRMTELYETVLRAKESAESQFKQLDGTHQLVLAECQSLSERVTAQEVELEAQRQQNAAMAEEMEVLRAQMAEMQKRLDDETKARAAAEESNDALKSRVSDLEKQIANFLLQAKESSERFDNLKQSHESEMTALQEKMTTALTNLAKAKEIAQNTAKQNEQLNQSASKAEAARQALQAEFEQAQAKANEDIRDLSAIVAGLKQDMEGAAHKHNLEVTGLKEELGFAQASFQEQIRRLGEAHHDAEAKQQLEAVYEALFTRLLRRYDTGQMPTLPVPQTERNQHLTERERAIHRCKKLAALFGCSIGFEGILRNYEEARNQGSKVSSSSSSSSLTTRKTRSASFVSKPQEIFRTK